MEVNDQLHDPAASVLERNLGTYWIRDWVDGFGKEKNAACVGIRGPQYPDRS